MENRQSIKNNLLGIKSILPQFAKGWIDSCLSQWIRPKSLVLKRWLGTSPPFSHPRRLCLFAHFDTQGKIAPYVIHYLKCLKELGAHIVFVSTAENLEDQEVSQILPYCIQVIQRKNIGLDFGSWRIGLLETRDWKLYDQIILANDSVYGPLFPLLPLFKKMEEQNLDVWGITSSREKEYHLQSYFLVFQRNAIQSHAFIKFWNQFRFFQSKSRIIQEYEIGFSQLAKKENWKIGALIECSQINDSSENPTLYSWRRLITEFHSPFFKVEILKLRRIPSEDLKHWKQFIQAHSTYDTELIQRHLNWLEK